MLVGKLKAKRVRKISKIGVPEGVKISFSEWGFNTFLNDTYINLLNIVRE
jgi:hypothetical protein